MKSFHELFEILHSLDQCSINKNLSNDGNHESTSAGMLYSIHEEHCKKIIITEGVSRTLQKSNIAQKNKVFH